MEEPTPEGTNTQGNGPQAPRMYTEEEVREHIRAAQERQLAADNERVYGNAFFAEALDHIGNLARNDQFWKDVYAYGTAFKRNFEVQTGQVTPVAAVSPPAQKQSGAPPGKKGRGEKPKEPAEQPPQE